MVPIHKAVQNEEHIREVADKLPSNEDSRDFVKTAKEVHCTVQRFVVRSTSQPNIQRTKVVIVHITACVIEEGVDPRLMQHCRRMRTESAEMA